MRNDEANVLVIMIGIANLVLLIWFIVSINRIKEELIQIKDYTRRTALALPLTSGQAKLINRAFTVDESVAIVEKQGGTFRIIRNMDYATTLVIDNDAAVNPELVTLVDEWKVRIIKFLRKRDVPD